jgi:hypothetical protein
MSPNISISREVASPPPAAAAAAAGACACLSKRKSSSGTIVVAAGSGGDMILQVAARMKRQRNAPFCCSPDRCEEEDESFYGSRSTSTSSSNFDCNICTSEEQITEEDPKSDGREEQEGPDRNSKSFLKDAAAFVLRNAQAIISQAEGGAFEQDSRIADHAYGRPLLDLATCSGGNDDSAASQSESFGRPFWL